MKHFEGIAASSLVALLGGLLMPKALYIGLDRGLLVWFVAIVASGIILGAMPNARMNVLKAAVMPAAVFPSTIAGFFVVRWLFSWIQSPETFQIFIPFGSGALVDPLAVLTALVVLMLIGMLASYVVAALAALASGPLMAAALNMYSFGPESIKRVQQIIVGIVGVVGALVLFWGALGTP